MSPYRTLRTCLDPGSSEWNETTMDEKIKILRKVAAIEDLRLVFRLYKKEYQEMNKPHVVESLEHGIRELFTYVLNS